MKFLIITVLSAFFTLSQATTNKPYGLLTDLIEHTDYTWQNGYVSNVPVWLADTAIEPLQFVETGSTRPMFSWIVPGEAQATYQTAYRIIVAGNIDDAVSGKGTVWDSGTVGSRQSTSVLYGGKDLEPKKNYFWRVKTVTNTGGESEWSDVKAFRTAANLSAYTASHYPQVKTLEHPVSVKHTGVSTRFIDFGKAAFGQLVLRLTSDTDKDSIVVHLGECTANGGVDRNPGGTIRYHRYVLGLMKGTHTYRIKITQDRRNTGRQAVLIPGFIGEVVPFRYCEIENYDKAVTASDVVRESVHYPFDDAASFFESNNDTLNQIWDLCKYSIKATSFLGIYVDGDRERIPYEADALINQLSHYGVDREYSMARRSHEYLLDYPTWPTEWILQAILIAWNDYLYTGDSRSLQANYDILQARTLLTLREKNGLISTTTGLLTPDVMASIRFNGAIRDIVDWPHTGILGLGQLEGGEADGFVFTDYNAVTNAYHYETLKLMGMIAEALDNQQDASFYRKEASAFLTRYNHFFFKNKPGYYVDGDTTLHASLHANMFPVAFGMTPPGRSDKILAHIRSRQMACSVYGSQFLMEALYEASDAEYALSMLTKTDDRGWYNMIRVGSTISLEAWDNKYKPNQDWNHAWGAAPANIIPRKLMGVEPLTPGFDRVRIKPQMASLTAAKAIVPTIKGAISIAIENKKGEYRLQLTIPANMEGDIYLPCLSNKYEVRSNGDVLKTTRVKDAPFISLGIIPSGTYSIVMTYRQVPSNKITVYTIGDSTMADQDTTDRNPARGWAQGMQSFFNADSVLVKNCAVNGSSSKSFFDEGHWKPIVSQLHPGDYVFIQFGNNNQNSDDPARLTDPKGAYRNFLTKYVNDTRAKGAFPVLMTPIVRRKFTPGVVEPIDTHSDYAAAVRELAIQFDVPLIDMAAQTGRHLVVIGSEDAKRLYMWLQPGQSPKYPDGLQDDTQLNELGAFRFAQMVKSSIRQLKLPLSLHLINNIYDLSWGNVANHQPDDWYGTDEAIAVAENVLLYQRITGGWPKNIPIHHKIDENEKKAVLSDKNKTDDSTMDNDATYMETVFLAKMYNKTRNEKYKDAFLKALDYILSAQYPNGGWPQYYPMPVSYFRHITYNDNCVVNMMTILKGIIERDALFSFVDNQELIKRCSEAFDRGIDCILKTQYRQNGKLTVWCAQHDEITLAPAQARSYELPSLSGSEAAGLVLFLMEIKNPKPELIKAIDAAVEWFEKMKITGIKVESFVGNDGLNDRRVVTDPSAPPIWARFYQLEDNRPFFCDRDGIKKYAMSEIGHERRNGYGWYTYAPQAVLDKYKEYVKARSQYEFLQMPVVDGEIQTASTFNGCSYYYRQSGDVAFRVEYKRAGETVWCAAHPTVCDQPEHIHKGSLFNLDEDTEYQLRILAVSDSKVLLQTVFRTWNSVPRIAKTIDLSTLPRTAHDGIVITEQGSPDAWVKYTAPDGWVVRRTLRNGDTQDGAIVLDGASYIILENLLVEGGKRHAILVDNCDYVRILNCDLSGWGRIGVQQFDRGQGWDVGQYVDDEGQTINLDGGIQIRKSYATVVERCYIHDPRGRSNSWMFSHPTGPEAIVAEYTRGGNVIRWNDFIGSDEHRWNDVIEGNSNHTLDGGLFRDSDIFGNYLAFGNDDGIELEGGGMNLRFIGNKIEGTLCGISFGANMIGPQYAVGNLVVNLGDEAGLALTFLKNGHGTQQKGKRFMYNNTFHGFNKSAVAYNPYGNATPVNAGLGTMRNNIFVCAPSRPSDWVRAENFDHDLFWVNRSLSETEQFVANFRSYGQEKNALAADPQFADPVIGNFHLAPSSIALGKATEVMGLTRAGDDLGAFFNGATDLPLRPLALIATPAQVSFDATGGDSTVTLSLCADAIDPVTFHIRQNAVFNWFSVTPASGSIAPGETLTLTVTADPAKLAGRPVFRGAFLVRTPNGLSRPVAVYAKGAYTEDKHPAAAGPNTVYLEAKSGVADKQIDIPEDGEYSLLVRVANNGQQGGSQEFEISINGETTTTALQSASWYLNTDVEQVAWLHSIGRLKAGTNRIQIKSTSPNLTVTEYIITDNPAIFFVQERSGYADVPSASLKSERDFPAPNDFPLFRYSIIPLFNYSITHNS